MKEAISNLEDGLVALHLTHEGLKKGQTTEETGSFMHDRKLLHL